VVAEAEVEVVIEVEDLVAEVAEALVAVEAVAVVEEAEVASPIMK